MDDVVGSPKRLEDLKKIEAGVKITCRRCKRERLVSRDRLIRSLSAKGLSTSWEALPGRLRCACGAKEVEIVAMPFTDGEEDGEALFEALVAAFKRSEALSRTDNSNADWCKRASENLRELHYAKTAMRAWIVARSEERKR